MMHHRYLSMYNESKGDKTVCISLKNSYLDANQKATIKVMQRAEANDRVYESGLFKSQRVENFVMRFNKMIISSMQSVFTYFKITAILSSQRKIRKHSLTRLMGPVDSDVAANCDEINRLAIDEAAITGKGKNNHICKKEQHIHISPDLSARKQ